MKKKTEESCELELIGIFQRSLLVSIKKNAQIVLIIEWNTVWNDSQRNLFGEWNSSELFFYSVVW